MKRFFGTTDDKLREAPNYVEQQMKAYIYGAQSLGFDIKQYTILEEGYDYIILKDNKLQ